FRWFAYPSQKPVFRLEIPIGIYSRNRQLHTKHSLVLICTQGPTYRHPKKNTTSLQGINPGMFPVTLVGRTALFIQKLRKCFRTKQTCAHAYSTSLYYHIWP